MNKIPVIAMYGDKARPVTYILIQCFYYQHVSGIEQRVAAASVGTGYDLSVLTHSIFSLLSCIGDEQ